jgi:hypothetical protein
MGGSKKKMNKEKVSLIIKNMESLVRLLKIEIEQEEENVLGEYELFPGYPVNLPDSKYEPDYYEEP